MTAQEPQDRATTTPTEETCPVCDRLVPSPIPESCPECGAPILTLISLHRFAEFIIRDTSRGLNSGNVNDIRKKLDVIRLSSKEHRIYAEILEARYELLLGKPADALRRIREIKESGIDLENALRESVDLLFQKANEDLTELAVCAEHYNLALFNAKRGHYEDALDSVKRALAIVPHHAESHTLAGKLYLSLRNPVDAEYHLRRAIALDSSNASAIKALSVLRKKQSPDIMSILTKGAKTSPKLLAWTGSALAILILVILAISAIFSRG